MNGLEIVNKKIQLNKEKERQIKEVIKEFYNFYELKQKELMNLCESETNHDMKFSGINLHLKYIYTCNYCGKTELRDK